MLLKEGSAAPKFTIKRVIPDAPVEDEDDDDDEAVRRIDSISSVMSDVDEELKGLKV